MKTALSDIIALLVVGHKASGKDELCRTLAGRATTYRLSDAIRAELLALGEPDPTVVRLQDFSNMRKAETGDPGLWAGRVIHLAAERGTPRIILNGVRNPGEIATAKAALGDRAVLVGITAPFDVRAARFLARGQAGDKLTMEDFRQLDARDRGLGEPPDGQQVDACMALVPPGNIYDNSGSLEAYRGWTNGLYHRIIDSLVA